MLRIAIKHTKTPLPGFLDHPSTVAHEGTVLNTINIHTKSRKFKHHNDGETGQLLLQCMLRRHFNNETEIKTTIIK